MSSQTSLRMFAWRLCHRQTLPTAAAPGLGLALLAWSLSIRAAEPPARSCLVLPPPTAVSRILTPDGPNQALGNDPRPDPTPDVDSLPTRKTGLQKLLFLRVRYPDDRDDPITETEAVQTLAETHQMFQRISQGRYGLIPTVTPVLALEHPRSDYDSLGGFDRLLNDARAAGIAAGFDYRDFDLEVVRHSGVPSFAGGNARLGVRGAQVQAGGAEILVHEIGHNLGLSHANFWDTAGPGIGADSPPLPSNYASLPEPRSIPLHPDSVIGHDTVIGPGRSLEYGDPWDIMGTGSSEFGGGSKVYLGWLPSPAVTNAPPGRSAFRLYEASAPDDGETALRLVRIADPIESPAGTRDYTLEVPPPRRDLPSTGGLLIRWIDPSPVPTGSLLLDSNPGSTQINTDALLLPGRTFSDPAAPLHVTVTAIGTNAAGHRWTEVVVVRERSATNHPPVITLAAAALTVDPTQPLALTAIVSDPDSDDVALAWDFGDGDVTHTLGAGSQTIEHAWKAVADVNVRVTATDFRGGLGIAQLTVRVGHPTTLRLHGSVLDPFGHPIVGARVHNGVESHGRPAEELAETRTDSQGRFVLVGLAPGRHAVAAFHPDYVMDRIPPVELVAQDRDGVALVGHALPQVEVETPARVTEAAGYTNLIVFRRTGPVDRPLTVSYRLSGSANAATDYVRPLIDRVTIPAGSSTATLALTFLADTVAEAPETLTVSVAYPTRFTRTDDSGNLVFTYYPGWDSAFFDGHLTWARTRPDYLPAATGHATMTIEDQPEHPHTLTLSRQFDGRLLVTPSGPAADLVVLESSPDLIHWLPLRTNRVSEFETDPVVVSAQEGARYYRTTRP